MSSSLLRRLGFYLGGVAIGLILFAFLVRGRGVKCEFDYLPNARTLKNIRAKKRVFSPQMQELLNNSEIDTAYISTILANGDVDFSRSKIKVDSCKQYIIEGMVETKEYELTVYNCDSTAIIQAIKVILE